jgi:4-coumarate--CoA ligase
MKGYLNNHTATANAITKDGWFKSGDIATRDEDGFFYVIDRKKELIKYKGCVEGHFSVWKYYLQTSPRFQVPPADLEAVLLTKEDIVDAGVIGIESKEQATELPRCFLSLIWFATMKNVCD